ncbi:primosomal protein N' [Bifidobacterium mongoliense]|uniref:primosomal protein N' n=1 Tax=Bifidobacterium mongoliense TaxID=518643 RepID=UPI0030EB8D64
MSQIDAEQLAFVGMAPRKRRKRARPERTPAAQRPIAQVVLDVQATHLGTTFDYLVDERYDDSAQPGVMVRVRFAGRLVNGVIWARVEQSPTPRSSLRFVERVVTPHVLVDRLLREDISAIADIYGGTRANILRLALPARVARVDQEPIWGPDGSRCARPSFHASDYPDLGGRLRDVERSYGHSKLLLDGIEGSGFGAFVLDMLPGQAQWATDLAALTLDAMTHGKSAVLVMPGMRETHMVGAALRRLGLKACPAEQPVHGSVRGDYLVLGAALPPEQRYRAFCAAASGAVTCVIGPRAAMYAPVQGPALFAIVEDVAYQHADGMMPYANARGVLRLRARSHHGVALVLANARSAVSQAEVGALDASGDTVVSGPSVAIHPLPAVVRDRSPWIRWLNRDELTRLADPTVGARVPHFAVHVLTEALDKGPVLLSIPHAGVEQTLGCTRCHRQARCLACTGPLLRASGPVPRCGWCGGAAVHWHCPHCGNTQMRMVRVGAAGTAHELSGLFRGVPMVISGPGQPKGVIATVPRRPMIVIATPGAEPLVTPADSHGYEAVAILDAWTSLYARGVDARIDVLNAWMRAVSLCRPRAEGGQALLIGESDVVLGRSLVLWDSSQLSSHELEERRQTALPPVLPCACIWGRRDAVQWLLHALGVLDGERAVVRVDGQDVPAVLGPVPIAPPTTMDARELEETRDRVKAIVRVPASDRADLALDLRAAVAKHVATRTPGELRFQLDPKDLL